MTHVDAVNDIESIRPSSIQICSSSRCSRSIVREDKVQSCTGLGGDGSLGALESNSIVASSGGGVDSRGSIRVPSKRRGDGIGGVGDGDETTVETRLLDERDDTVLKFLDVVNQKTNDYK